MTILNNIELLTTIGSSSYYYTYSSVKNVASNFLLIQLTAEWKEYHHCMFAECFGVLLHVAVALWMLLTATTALNKLEIKHMFWCLSYLKTYGTMHNMATSLLTTKPTLQKWVWDVMDKIALLSDILVSTMPT